MAQFLWLLPIAVVLVVSMVLAPKARAERPALSVKNVIPVGHLDIDGGGQVVVQNGYAYIGHMLSGTAGGTSILDVSDPRNPKLVSRIYAPVGIHSHKVRVDDKLQIMMVNYEQQGTTTSKTGLAIFDISDRSKPKLLTIWSDGGKGVHRYTYDFQRKYVYLSADVRNYNGAIFVVLDVHNPREPLEVARWWLPGQGPGENFDYDPLWSGIPGDFRVHHPLLGPDGNFYMGYWNGGYVVARAYWDASGSRITGFQKEPLAHVNWAMTIKSPGHTFLPVFHKVAGWDVAVLTDEDIDQVVDPKYQPGMWVAWVDRFKADRCVITPISHYRIPQPDYITNAPEKPNFGTHQPHEYVAEDNLVYVAWWAGGLRIVDISDPFKPVEVGHFLPAPGAGNKFTASNDVFVHEGLIYVLDRFNGLDIVKYNKAP